VRASVYAAIPRSCSFCSLRIQALSREESIYEEHFVEVEMEVEVEVEVEGKERKGKVAAFLCALFAYLFLISSSVRVAAAGGEGLLRLYL
jgi:hypothetical protein